jgi:hypothetical protein
MEVNKAVKREVYREVVENICAWIEKRRPTSSAKRLDVWTVTVRSELRQIVESLHIER